MAERFENDEGVITHTEAEKKVERPRLFKVLMHNDDYTTREFVVEVLRHVFHKSESDAVQVMLHVHNNGHGIAGVFTREIAETKVSRVEQLANQYEFPLRLSMEPED
jgi:ATP-dependent Clp protease adaptor protein ClpS